MIGILGGIAAWIAANPRWLASLAAAAAINVLMLGLMSWGHMGSIPRSESPPPATAIEFVVRARVPPPPDLSSAALAPEEMSPRLPARFRPKLPALRGLPELNDALALPAPGLQLNLNPCDPKALDALRPPECDAAQDWVRAGRDASELFGPDTSGLTLRELARERGWTRDKLPDIRRDGMVGKTDSTLPDTIFKDSPF